MLLRRPSRFAFPAALVVTLAVAAAAALQAGPASAGQPAATARAQLTLSVSSGPPASAVRVSGTGFGPGQKVVLRFGSARRGGTQASSSGRFGPVRITVPRSARPGRHWITAVGVQNGRMARAGFTVRASWPQSGFSTGRSSDNALENVLTARNVHKLRRRWGAAEPGGQTTFSAATVAGGTVYLGTESGVYARNATTGRNRWHAAVGSAVDSTPAVVNGVVYVAVVPDLVAQVVALKASTGKKLWDFPGNGAEAPYRAPAVAGSLVYVSNGQFIFALKAASGQVAWSFSTSGLEVSDLAVADGRVYFSSLGAFYALSAATGRVAWRVRTSVADPSYYSPAVAGGAVFIEDNQTLYALKASSGAQLWHRRLAGGDVGVPAVASGVVYAGTLNSTSLQTFLYALRAATGRQLWHHSTGFDNNLTSPAVANGVVYLDVLGTLEGVSAATGHRLWSSKTGAGASPLTVVNGMVYVGGTTNVEAFALPRR